MPKRAADFRNELESTDLDGKIEVSNVELLANCNLLKSLAIGSMAADRANTMGLWLVTERSSGEISFGGDIVFFEPVLPSSSKLSSDSSAESTDVTE